MTINPISPLFQTLSHVLRTKRFLVALGCLAIWAGHARAQSADPVDSEAIAPRANVLMIAVDDLACTLGCYGDRIAITPHIDALAARGVRFDRAYNQLPLCNPTRASLMTGLRPDRIGVYDLDRHFRDAMPNVITLPQAFRADGYRVARVGKIYHYNVPAGIGTNGLDDAPSWDQVINPIGRDKTDESLVINAEPHRKISAALSWLAADGTDEQQTDGKIATEAIQWMERQGDQPFFLAVGFFRPHTPYIAPKKYFELYPPEAMRLPFAPKDDRADIPTAAFAHNCPIPNYNLPEDVLLQATSAYYASVSFIDAQVGRLTSALEELGLSDNTIICFWSDHGYHLGEHGGVWQKRTLFENSARAPLIVHVPGNRTASSVSKSRSSGHTTCERVVEFVDVYPTLLEAAGIKPTQTLDGRSLMPLILDPLLPWDNGAVTQVVRPADDRLPEPVMGRSIRTQRYRYTEWDEGRAGRELYDYQSDPGEFRNLLGKRNATEIETEKVTDTNERSKSAQALENVVERLSRELSAKATGIVPDVPINPARL